MSAAPKDAEAAPKKKSKLPIIIIASVVVLGAGGGGAWFFLKSKDPNAAHAEAPPKPAVFMPLEMFTVNLVPQEGQPQYLQAGLTLKLGEQVKEATIKDKMPEIRDRILMVLSSKKASEVLPADGKKKLAKDIVAAISSVVGLAAPKAHAAPVQAEPAPGEAAAAEPPKKKAAKAEGDAEAKAEGEEAEAAPPPKPVKKVAAAPQIEVLFTSFIVQ